MKLFVDEFKVMRISLIYYDKHNLYTIYLNVFTYFGYWEGLETRHWL